MYAIETNQISKCYRSGVEALKDISISVKQGEIYCLLGKNGAGKSTLINILSTYFCATKGSIKIFNTQLTHTNINEIRSQLATVAQQISVDTHLTLQENMLFQAELYNIPKKEALQKMNKLITGFELNNYLKYPVSSFSGGIKRRLDIALNLMCDPKIIFLDEPTVGMDVQSRKEMWKMIRHIRDELHTTIFLTTHYLEEAEQLSDTICIMKEGKIMIQESTEKIKNHFHDALITIDFSSNKVAKEYYPFLKKELRPFYQTISLAGNCITLLNKKDYDLAYFMKWLLNNEIMIDGISLTQPTLETIFLRLVEEGRGIDESNAYTQTSD